MYSTTHRVIMLSVLVATVINFVENIFHFSIGYNSAPNANEDNSNSSYSKEYIHLRVPTVSDMIKIILVMMIFAIVQYTGTLLVTRTFLHE